MKKLQLKNLLFKFDAHENYFFNKFSFQVSTGLTFIKGRNGSGKSTLFRILTGNTDATEVVSGQIIIDDKVYDLQSGSDCAYVSSTIMLIPQNYNQMLADQFTALENLTCAKFLKYPRLTLPSSHIDTLKLLEQFGLPLHKPVSLLSGGQKQILAIAMALEKKASILLLDEPTATLDDNNAAIVMTFLKNLVREQNIIILCICHDQEIIDLYKDDYFEVVR